MSPWAYLTAAWSRRETDAEVLRIVTEAVRRGGLVLGLEGTGPQQVQLESSCRQEQILGRLDAFVYGGACVGVIASTFGRADDDPGCTSTQSGGPSRLPRTPMTTGREARFTTPFTQSYVSTACSMAGRHEVTGFKSGVVSEMTSSVLEQCT